MTEYVVLLPGDESVWEAASEEERAATYARHAEFSRLLEGRGHRITGGAELAHSRGARTVRSDGAGGTVVTDGPYAETVEQLSGFYLVESDDLEDLLDVCGLLVAPGEAVEVRATIAAGPDATGGAA
ncbi:transcription initiation protein [Nocardioides sp. zg-579]|uniref:Transcription initiation protein n=1 Tax=Nocardioides marmotae TaxID=2663857 RepID=A0A6I3JD22_9ACTN|nr:YciI family protein [Nocardioides marmotae]MCR6032285.1 transcription initiation protein [Gordonia jinghuaiqii]MTB95933.1 transcription initiation protein [Nocardioides marmotae]QKE02729.1 transcription initiation protein [Nocardioides marmotae]